MGFGHKKKSVRLLLNEDSRICVGGDEKNAILWGFNGCVWGCYERKGCNIL